MLEPTNEIGSQQEQTDPRALRNRPAQVLLQLGHRNLIWTFECHANFGHDRLRCDF